MSSNAVTRWDFTLKAEGLDIDELKARIKEDCKKWCFQLEEGESGYKHFQGRVSLKVKARKGPQWYPAVRWSVTSNANKENDFYVMKSETRIDGPWSDQDKYIPRQVRGIKLYPWQQRILEDRLDFDTRTINIVYDTAGNKGKSTLCTYAGSKGLARRIPILESYKDFMRMVMDTPKSSLYLVDFPRGLSKGNCVSFWGAIETLKDGYAYDDRYNFREEYFDSPNIWVFCNKLPDFELLSRAR